jgi:CHRD domain
VIRKRYYALGALAAVGLTLAVVSSVGAQGGGDRAIFAVMTGAKEVDVNGEHHGDPNGRGTFSATLDGRQLCYGITVKNIENPVAAHIHRGSAKVAGPVVQPLDQPATGDPGASSACVRISRSLARGLRRNPSRFYVNVHTASLPNGAVRGQLFARSR